MHGASGFFLVRYVSFYHLFLFLYINLLILFTVTLQMTVMKLPPKTGCHVKNNHNRDEDNRGFFFFFPLCFIDFN